MAAFVSSAERARPAADQPALEFSKIPFPPALAHVAPTSISPLAAKATAVSAVPPHDRPARDEARDFSVTAECQADKSPELVSTVAPDEPMRAAMSPVLEPASASGTGVSGRSATPGAQ